MAENMTLKLRQVIDISAGLKRLNGVMTNGLFSPYEFSPRTTWNIAKNGTIFDREVEAFNKAQRQMAAADLLHDGDAVGPANAARFSAYKDKLEELKDKDVEVRGVLILTLSELLEKPATTSSKAKTNGILPGILTQIMPIIKEDREL
jgi:hypothetical protein